MSNCVDIFMFEIKKIAGRKITVCAYFLMLFVTVFINLQSIPLYSIGTEGEQTTVMTKGGERGNDWNAFFHGLTIRWIDANGKEVKRKVGPMEYIRLQRKFAKRWSGQSLDDETIKAMRRFLADYAHIQEDGSLDGWNYQNYYWVWKTISHLGLNPVNPKLSESTIQNLVGEQGNELFEYLTLSEEEQSFWNHHKKLSYPLKMAYTPAYRQILLDLRWIHMMLLFFVILMLCESFAIEDKYNTRSLLQATRKGPVSSFLARMIAGLLLTMIAALSMFAITIIIQFVIFGTDGWSSPIQQIGGLQWSRLMVTAGEAVFFMCGTSLVILSAVAVFTMAISELTRNGILPMWVQLIALILTLVFDRGIFYWDRTTAQIWRYLPMQRVNDTLLYDERLIMVGKHLVTAIPFSTCLYLMAAMVFLVFCAGHAIIFRYDR